MVPRAHRFSLDLRHVKAILTPAPKFGFNGFGEAVYYRSYSRTKEDGTQEAWGDTVLRVVEGVMSIRKHHYLANKIAWDEQRWQDFAAGMARSLFKMEWLPAGRGLWAMGTEHVYQKGSMALYNCGACTTADLSKAAEWTMDALMCGVGVGFDTAWDGRVAQPKENDPDPFAVSDSREGWAESLRRLIDAYTRGASRPAFDYSRIRPAGTPIRGLGGTSPGPEPLKRLHEKVEALLESYCAGEIGTTRCIVDLFNFIGVCVVAGNVRRSAEIALGRIDDPDFLELKAYAKHPEREAFGWVGNNSVILETPEDYTKLSSLVPFIEHNGEPGILNRVTIARYGRFGEERPDAATLANPCGEIALESFELCNLAEAFPTRCENKEQLLQALEYAAFYTAAVTLLPTHREESNAVIARNRRTGVAVGGVVDAIAAMGEKAFVELLREGYERVKAVNTGLAEEAGVPPAIRLTTIKPSGTISQLAGVSPGMHHFPFRYALRRMRVGNALPICELLKQSGIPWEADRVSPDTTVFAFPVAFESSPPGSGVSAKEQFELLALLQKEWADNMVSCTITFEREKEAILPLLEAYIPKIKSVSLLPRTPQGAYPQMPYEEISKAEYESRVAMMQPIDWSQLKNSDGEASKFCYEGECRI